MRCIEMCPDSRQRVTRYSSTSHTKRAGHAHGVRAPLETMVRVCLQEGTQDIPFADKPVCMVSGFIPLRIIRAFEPTGMVPYLHFAITQHFDPSKQSVGMISDFSISHSTFSNTLPPSFWRLSPSVCPVCLHPVCRSKLYPDPLTGVG